MNERFDEKALRLGSYYRMGVADFVDNLRATRLESAMMKCRLHNNVWPCSICSPEDFQRHFKLRLHQAKTYGISPSTCNSLGESTMKRKKKGRTLGQALLSGDIRYLGQVEVKGGYYHDMWEAKVDGLLIEGAWLKLKREEENQHDANAISVWVTPRDMMSQRIGYIAKEQAEVYAPLMDLGIKLAARVFEHSCKGQPIRLIARLYGKK